MEKKWLFRIKQTRRIVQLIYLRFLTMS
jgi:hypothetical protein